MSRGLNKLMNDTYCVDYDHFLADDDNDDDAIIMMMSGANEDYGRDITKMNL